MYFDELALVAVSSALILGLSYFLFNKKSDEIADAEPTYLTGRGDRSPHEHRYDTMDAGTAGKWVCAICRKVKP